MLAETPLQALEKQHQRKKQNGSCAHQCDSRRRNAIRSNLIKSNLTANTLKLQDDDKHETHAQLFELLHVSQGGPVAAPPKHSPMMRERHLVTPLKRNSCSAWRSPLASSACPRTVRCHSVAHVDVHRVTCTAVLGVQTQLETCPGREWLGPSHLMLVDQTTWCEPFRSSRPGPCMSTPAAANTSSTVSKCATKFLRLAQLLLTCTLIMVNRALPSVWHLIEQALATTHESAH